MKKALFFLSLLMAGMAPTLNAQNAASKEKIKQLLTQVNYEKNLSEKDLFEIGITDEYVSRTSGTKHIYLRQMVDGLEILGTESSLHLNANEELLVGHNYFVNSLERRKRGNSTPKISAVDAVTAAASHLKYAITEPITALSQNQAEKSTLLSRGGISLSDIPVDLKYLLLDDGSIVLVWDLSIESVSKAEWYNVRVNAHTGEVINKVNWVTSCGFTCSHSHDENISHTHQNILEASGYAETDAISTSSYEFIESESLVISGTYNVFPMPIESPFYGSRSMVSALEAVNTDASPYGWHDTNGSPGAEYTITRGNNVYAYEDEDGYNGNNPGSSPNGGSSLVFNYSFNPVYSSGNKSQAAAITNLFYWNNIVHDVAYIYGFDEASGNFQQNNYGKGGLGNDYVRAEAQDGGGTCNANFATPPDGNLPRMQMYICGDKDGDFDNVVIIHEYGHGISIRLTGGPGTASCLNNNEQMGEGWSDWFGLMLTMNADESGADPRGIGTYLFGQAAGGPGIRAYPYSTNMAINPHTYNSIKTAAVPHGVGSVWAVMLWEMTWGLIDKYGFDDDIYYGTGGNNIAMSLVIEALKLQPCNPGFVDGRDAILAADQILYGGVNQCIIWAAFAKRGLGFSATQGSSSSTTDGVEAFDTPNITASYIAPGNICQSQGVIHGLNGGSPYGGVYTGPGVTDEGNGHTYTFDPIAAGPGVHTITYTLPAHACGGPSSDVDSIEVYPGIEISGCSSNIYVNAMSNCGAIVTFDSPVGSSGCNNAVFEDFDSVTEPSLPLGWLSQQHTGNGIVWKTVTTQSLSTPNAAYANNPAGVNSSSLRTPEYEIGTTSNAQLKFKIYYATEFVYDGMVLEYSVNEGSWKDILDGGGTFFMGGYNDTINTNYSNPLGGRQAWTGNSGGFVDVIVNLDTSLNNNNVRFRWRMGTDAYVGSLGVWLDNIEISGLKTPPTTVVQTSGLPSGSEFPIGSTTVTFEATDGSGNVVECSFDVIVSDTIPPVAQAQDITVALDAFGQALITVDDIDDGSYDNCSVVNREISQISFNCADVGQNIVTLTVYDGSGNYATAQATVTVVEDVVPVAQAQDITVYLDAFGQAVITPADIDNGSSDNCGISSMTVTPDTFYCSDIGTHTVTLTVYDGSGNYATAQATVTVVEDVVPVAQAQDITVYLDAFGQAVITPADIDNGSSDNCGISSMTVTPDTFGCSDIGTHTVTLTVYDGSGNYATAQATVTVVEDVVPVAQAQDITVYLDAFGQAVITPADIDNGSSDNCGISSMSVTPDTFDCSDIGTHTVTLTVYDGSGNYATAQATVTVVEDVVPVAQAQDITVYLDAFGQAVITPADIDNGSSDNCGISSMTVTPDTFDCSDIGTHTVTLTVYDGSGNYATAQATVTVVEDVVPVAQAQDITVYLDAFGQAVITPADIDNGSSDNCGISSMTVTPDTFDCSDIGTHTVTLTVYDGSGNYATAQATVTVVEDVVPVAQAQDITVYLDAFGQAVITPADIDNGSSDNCGISSMTVTPDTFGCSDIGTHTVTLTVYDGSGNYATAQATVTVVEDVVPVAQAQDITVYLDAFGQAVITPADIDNGSSDNCGISSMTVTPDTFDCSDIGTHTVTLTVYDGSGNYATAQATVTVVEDVVPVAQAQDITVYLDAFGQAVITPADIDNGSSDNCGISSMSVTPDTFDCSDIGTHTVTLTVYDGSGNYATAQATVTVVEDVVPVAQAQDITVYLDAFGQAVITPADIDNGSSDNCGISSMTVTPDTFDCSDIGTHTVTLTVYDGSGNYATAQATVTVVEDVVPVAQAQDITVYLDAFGQAVITPADIDNGSSDNCGISSMTVTPDTFDCSDIGTHTVTLTVYDGSGNYATAQATVTVVEDVVPVAQAQDITVYLDAFGQAVITPADIDNGSSDNCGISSMTVTPDTFDCSDIGTHTVTLTVYDGSGNYATAQATVTVVEDVVPVAQAQDITVYLDAFGQAVITPADIDNGSSDNCGISSMTVTPDTFDCSDIGTHTVTLTVYDGSGNYATAQATVTVVEDVVPVAQAQDITVYLDAFGQAVITPADIDNGSSDNCGISSMTVTPDTFGCSDIGTHTVTLTVYDGSGNYATAQATVTVVEDVVPVAQAQDITVYLDAFGQAVITPADIDNGSSDNCGISSMTVTPDTFDCSDIGTHTVTLTVYDGSGNYATAQATVTVVEDVVPVAQAQDITVYLDAFGQAVITPADIDNGSSDNCGISSMSVTPDTFGCSDIGTHTVTLTVYDGSGNYATAQATVTVVEDVVPVAQAQDITVYLDAFGQAVITPADIDNGSSDNCGISSMTVTPDTFDCSDIGTHTVTLTVYDGSGNYATAQATVTVVEDVVPVAQAQDITVYLDAFGQAVITPADIDNGSSDNCGISSMTVTPDTFDCSDIGTHTVTLTVYDGSGNYATAQATVTVVEDVVPVAQAQDITVYLDAFGQAVITPADIDNGSSDNCGISSMTVTPDTFDCSDIGTHTVTLTVYDGSGNYATAQATVTVVEDVVPVAQAQDITVYLDAFGQAVITPADIDNGSSDNCGISSMTVTPDTFDCSDIGTHTVTLTVYDGSGNYATAQATVTVVEDVVPVAQAQDITVYLDAFGQAVITPADIDNGSSDNCGISSMSVTPDTFYCSDIGTHTVTLTVYDGSGNYATAQATVTVVEDVVPVAQAQDITVYLDAFGQAVITPADIDNGSSDNCGISSMTVTPDTFGCSDIGTHTVTLTVYDGSGNYATAQATVTVVEDVVPVAQAQDITVYLDAFGQAVITPADIDNGSSDNCGISSMTVTPDTFDCSDIGTHTVTLTVYDGSGNYATAQATVTVVEDVVPVAQAQDITVYLDAFGQAVITPADIDNGSSDNCGISSMSVTPDTFDCSDIGTHTVTLTVYDGSGNYATAQATVTVADIMAPEVIGQNITLPVNEDGMATILPQDVDNGSWDNCGISSMTVFPTSFSCDNLGDNTVTLTVFDIVGNSASVQVIVTVVDVDAPVLECPMDLEVEIPAGTTYTLPNYWLEEIVTATDNCTNPITNVVQTPSPGTELSVGTHTIEIEVADDSGNIATCSFELEVHAVMAIEEMPFNDMGIVVFPNPTRGDLILLNKTNWVLDYILITDVQGKVIKEIKTDSYIREQNISLNEYASGVYFLRIYSGNYSIIKQIIRR